MRIIYAVILRYRFYCSVLSKTAKQQRKQGAKRMNTGRGPGGRRRVGRLRVGLQPRLPPLTPGPAEQLLAFPAAACRVAFSRGVGPRAQRSLSQDPRSGARGGLRRLGPAQGGRPTRARCARPSDRSTCSVVARSPQDVLLSTVCTLHVTT